MENQDLEILVVALAPYKLATRARKAAKVYSAAGATHYVSLAAAGRTGRRTEPGRSVVDGIEINQIKVRTIRTAPTLPNHALNFLCTYAPAALVMLRNVMATPAEVVHVVDPQLCIIGMAHRWRYGSKLVLDVPERPSKLIAYGSLNSLLSRLEPAIFKLSTSRVDLVTVAVPSDVEILRGRGFTRVIAVRNCPLAEWRAPYVPPAPRQHRCLRAVVVGSIVEYRGYETALQAIAECKSRGFGISLDIYGFARDAYLDHLQALATKLCLDGCVRWLGRLDTEAVSAAYLSADIGLVLYEPIDPGNDGLSNKILECVSSGRPVVAGNLPENRKFVSAYGVGWLAEMSAQGLVDTLCRVATLSDMTEISAKCRALGDDELTWDREFTRVTSNLSEGAQR